MLNGMPTQTLAAIATDERRVRVGQPFRMPSLEPDLAQSAMDDPESPSSSQRNRLPVTTPGSSQPRTSSARRRARSPGTGRPKNSANASPMLN